MQITTELQIRHAKGIKGKTQKITVQGGLQLWVSINQAGNTAKNWYLRYYDSEGKRQRSKIGAYPEMTLAKALAAAEDAKKQAKKSTVTLAEQQKRVNAEAAETVTIRVDTFETVAEQWLAKKSLSWVPKHTKRQRERMQGHLFHALGNKPINEITMQDIDAAIMPLVTTGKSETAKRATDLVRNVMEYAETMDLLQNPAIIRRIAHYRRQVPAVYGKRHLYREMTPEDAGKLLLALEESKHRWTRQTSVAIRLAPYVILRPSELCEAEWSELSLEKAEWFIPAARMKSRRDHIVPLSRQALALFEEIKPLTGGDRFVFPSWSKKGPITSNALIQVLRRLGYKSTRKEGEASFVTHGFRGLASTTLYQYLKFSGDWIEHQLAHVEPNKVKAAYNQIGTRSYLEERRGMMQAYADYLDGLRAQAGHLVEPMANK